MAHHTMTSASSDTSSKPLFCGNCDDCPFRNPDRYPPGERLMLSALIYAEQGIAVYPTEADGLANMKGLRTKKEVQLGKKGGIHLATTDHDKIRSWARFWKNPEANIAVRTGAVSRLMIIDCDVKTEVVKPDEMPIGSTITVSDLVGEERTTVGIESFRAWEAEKGITIPRDVVTTTPSNGDRQHIWRRLPATWTSYVKSGEWLKAVDLLWDGHAAKVPPSVRKANEGKCAGEYRFINGCPCQVGEAPLNELVMITSTPLMTRKGGGGNGTGSRGGSIDIDYLLEHGAEDEHDNTLTAAASHLAARGYYEDEIVDILQRIVDATELANPNWTWSHENLMRKACTGIEYVAQKRAEETAELKSRFAWAQSLGADKGGIR